MDTRPIQPLALVLVVALGSVAAGRDAVPPAPRPEAPWTTIGLTGSLRVGPSAGTAARPAIVQHQPLSELGAAAGGAAAACNACHEINLAVTHPVGVVPSMRVPSDFPLDASGRTTCLTCHDIPATADGASAMASRSFLRGGLEGRAFCDRCHTRSQASANSSHALLLESAHGGSSPAAARGAADLDGESLDCMGCHDGSIGDDASAELHLAGSDGAGAGTIGQEIGRSHPIGVSYQDAARRGTPLARLGPRHASVRLYDGRVGCGSCHSPYSRLPKLLVVEIRGSGLCLECHET